MVEIVKQYLSHAGVTALCTELGASAVSVWHQRPGGSLVGSQESGSNIREGIGICRVDVFATGSKDQGNAVICTAVRGQIFPYQLRPPKLPPQYTCRPHRSSFTGLTVPSNHHCDGVNSTSDILWQSV